MKTPGTSFMNRLQAFPRPRDWPGILRRSTRRRLRVGWAGAGSAIFKRSPRGCCWASYLCPAHGEFLLRGSSVPAARRHGRVSNGASWKSCLRWVLALSFVLPALAADWGESAIETELAATQTYLAIIDVDDEHTAGASIKLPDLGGDELVKIDFKPNGMRSSLFRFYWFRNGQLELFREYDWVARDKLADFERKSERFVRFERDSPVASDDGPLPDDMDAIRREGERLYTLLKEQRASR